MKSILITISAALLVACITPAKANNPITVTIVKQDAEVKAYKDEQLKKIKENEDRIAELKRKRDSTKGKVDDAYDKRIEKLEASNAELKKRVITYNETDKSKWEEFKREFSHDMDELGQALKDMFRDNSK
jgi:hypothetical protein